MLALTLHAPALVSPLVSTRQHAAELSQFGLTVLSDPQLDRARLEQVRQRCSSRLSTLIDELSGAVDPIEQHYTFTEIAHRQRLRWDLRLPEDDPLWRCACEAVLGAATPVVEQLHPPRAAAAARTLMSGVLISRSVAAHRTWLHARSVRAWPPADLSARPRAGLGRRRSDGTSTATWSTCRGQLPTRTAASTTASCRSLTLRWRLAEPHPNPHPDPKPWPQTLAPNPSLKRCLALQADGTEFWPTSHAASAVDPSLPPPTCPPLGAAVAPACPAGGLVIADYRTMHRGLANVADGGRERQIAYVVLGNGDGAMDTANFSPTAIRDTSPSVLEQLPFWSDWE